MEKTEVNLYDPVDTWDKAFAPAVRKRLVEGRGRYKDSNIRRPIIDFVAEMQEELVDALGWCSLAWARLEIVRQKAIRRDDNRDVMGKDFTRETVLPVWLNNTVKPYMQVIKPEKALCDLDGYEENDEQD